MNVGYVSVSLFYRGFWFCGVFFRNHVGMADSSSYETVIFGDRDSCEKISVGIST